MAGDDIDNSLIFLALLPFILYLIMSGKISEFKGGGLELRFNRVSESDVIPDKLREKFKREGNSISNNATLRQIRGFRTHHVDNYHSNKEVLKILEKIGFTDIAVVDIEMKFKGFTNREMILSKIMSNLALKNE